MTRTAERGLLLALIGALAGPGPSWAQSAEPAVAAAPKTIGNSGYRRPGGPINIEAQSADILRDGTAVYRGDVSISGTDFSLLGEVVELHQLAPRQFRIVVTGTPAHFAHKGGEGADAPPVDAQAQRIEYDASKDIVILNGAVTLLRGRDRLTTDELRYDLAERRIQASGGASGQVRITLDPAELRGQEDAR